MHPPQSTSQMTINIYVDSVFAEKRYVQISKCLYKSNWLEMSDLLACTISMLLWEKTLSDPIILGDILCDTSQERYSD